MKKMAYSSPQLIVYGQMAHLTLGGGGTINDIDQNGNDVGDCAGETYVYNGVVYYRATCTVVTGT